MQNYSLFPNSRQFRQALPLVMLLLIFGSGCTTVPRLTVAIDAISSPVAIEAKRYVLRPKVAGVDEGDLHFIEYAKHIHAALEPHGYQAVASAADADLLIDVTYGSSREERAVSRPVYYDDFYAWRYRCLRRTAAGRCLQRRSPFYRGQSDYWYRYRNTWPVDIVTANRVFIALEAHATDADENASAIWSTRARALVAKADLRVTLPLLLIAVREYIGTDTGHEVAVVLRADDPAVQALGVSE